MEMLLNSTQNKTVFGDICDLLYQQFRLSDLEQEIMYWLAMSGSQFPLSIARGHCICCITTKSIGGAGIFRAAIAIEKHAGYFTLQPVVMGIDQLIEQVCEEIATKDVLDLNARTEAFRLEQSSRQSSQKIIRFNRHAD